MTNKNRFEQLVRFVCQIADRQKLGAVKLNKILWYIDTYSFKRWGKSMSGETAYIKRQMGPVPKNILAVLEKLEKKGVLMVQEGILKREYITLKNIDPTKTFASEEIEVIRGIVDEICDNYTADSISELSHTRIWRAAKNGGEIPVYAVLAENSAPITSADKKWAKSIIAKQAVPA